MPTEPEFGINSKEQASTFIKQRKINLEELVRDAACACDFLRREYHDEGERQKAEKISQLKKQLNSVSATTIGIFDDLEDVVASDIHYDEEIEDRIKRRLEGLGRNGN